jgi:hypothetical protein
VLEKNQPELWEGATMVTMGSPSKLPLDFHFVLGTFTRISERLGGNTTKVDHEPENVKKLDANYVALYIWLVSIEVCHEQ